MYNLAAESNWGWRLQARENREHTKIKLKKGNKKMKKEEFIQIVKERFNSKRLAEILECSQGRILELRKEPVDGQVYHVADINAEAIYDFAIKRLNEISEEKAKALREMIKENSRVSKEYKPGTIIKGLEIISATRIYKVLTYVVKDVNAGNVFAISSKDLEAL